MLFHRIPEIDWLQQLLNAVLNRAFNIQFKTTLVV